MEKKVKLELTERDAFEVSSSLLYVIDPVLSEYGENERITKHIEIDVGVVNKIVKQLPDIVNDSMFPKDIWKRCRQVIERGGIPEAPSDGLEEFHKKSAEEIAKEVLKFAKKKFRGPPAPYRAREIVDDYLLERKISPHALRGKSSVKRAHVRLIVLKRLHKRRLEEQGE